MFKYLAPEKGLWHIGEQCAVDLYLDVDSNEYLEINMLDYPDYKYSMFQGKSIIEAKEWLSNKKVIL